MGRLLVMRHPAVLFAGGVFWVLGAVARGADEFNQERLDEGRIAFQQKRFTEAIDQFRVAAFGSLDRPEALSECLARLSLAQDAAGRVNETNETLSRFLEVEQRFGAYKKANLEPELRADFSGLLVRRVPPAALLAVPSLANLVETEERKIAKLPPTERRKALREKAKLEPDSVRWPIALAREAQERGDAKEADRWMAKARSLDPENAEVKALQATGSEPSTAGRSQAARAPEPPASAPSESPAGPPAKGAPAPAAGSPAATARSRDVLELSRRLVSESRANDAVPLLTDALRADPGSRELRLALLEAACLSRSYPLAVAQVPMSAPFNDREAPSLFYAAVALYETGHGADARGYLQRALPGVSGPLVDEYSKKILGSAR